MNIQHFNRENFIQDVPVDSRIVGILKKDWEEKIENGETKNLLTEMNENYVMVIEESNLDLKELKDKYPDYLFKTQKVEDVADYSANVELLEKIENMKSMHKRKSSKYSKPKM